MKTIVNNEWKITIQETERTFEAWIENTVIGAKMFMFAMSNRDLNEEAFARLAEANVEDYKNIYVDEFVKKNEISDMVRFSINVSKEDKELITWALINSKVSDEQTAEFWRNSGNEEYYKEYLVQANETDKLLKKINEIGCMEWVNSGTIEIKV